MSFFDTVLPLALAGAFLLRSRLDYIIVLPLICSMVIAFSVDNLGSNIAHAPGYFIPILCLSGVVIGRDSLVKMKIRMFVYAMVACLTTYLDLLHGPLPFIMTAVIIVNHLLYNSHVKPVKNNQWVMEAIGIIVIFSFSAILLTLLKMVAAAPFVNHNVFTEFAHLSLRLSNKAGGIDSTTTISHLQTFEKLWQHSFVYFCGSTIAATAYYVFAAISWFLVAVMILFGAISRKQIKYSREILILFICGALIVVWFYLFNNHTYIDPHFMGRLAIIPASTGIMALLYCCLSKWNHLLYRVNGGNYGVGRAASWRFNASISAGGVSAKKNTK